MTQDRTGLLALYASALLLALNGLFAKLIPLDATSMTQLRSVVAALGLLGFCLLGKRHWRLGCIRQYFAVYGLGLLLGLHWITFFHAMQISTVAVGMLALFSYPVITILIEPFFARTRLQAGDLIAGCLVVLGLAVMVWEELQLAANSDMVMGCVWGVISALLFSLRNLTMKYRFHHIASDRLMLHQVIAIAFLLLLFVDVSAVKEMKLSDWSLLVTLGLITTAAAHTLLAFSLKKLPAKTVAIIGCSQPVIGAIAAWLVVSEQPGWSVVIGGAIILSVAIYETLSKTRRQISRLA
ncbi:DMT family transporter [Porticoccaceae bacterium LTM1]|nr:DMT family transporter [Porticoccaceae bacterium LTM1]